MMHRFHAKNLEVLCPSCRTPHDKKFSTTFWGHDCYLKLICPVCNYKIIIKTDSFLTTETPKHEEDRHTLEAHLIN